MYVRLNCEPLDEVDCIKYPWGLKRLRTEDVKRMLYNE